MPNWGIIVFRRKNVPGEETDARFQDITTPDRSILYPDKYYENVKISKNTILSDYFMTDVSTMRNILSANVVFQDDEKRAITERIIVLLNQGPAYDNNGTDLTLLMLVALTAHPEFTSDQVDSIIFGIDDYAEKNANLQAIWDIYRLTLLTMNPSQMDNYSKLYDLDSETFGKMIDKASDWPCHRLLPGEPPYYGNRDTSHFPHDLAFIAGMAKKHPEEKMIKTLYEGAGWIYFYNDHSEKYFDYLFKFLKGEIDISRYPHDQRFININTTRGDGALNHFTRAMDWAFYHYGGSAGKNYEDGKMFFLSIQPGNTDENKRIYAWLQEHIKDSEKPFLSEHKFQIGMFSMHGTKDVMLLKAEKDSDKTQGDIDMAKYFIWTGATDAYKAFANTWFDSPSQNLPYGYPVIINNACSTGEEEELSLAQAMANNIPAIVIAATKAATGLNEMPFIQTEKGWTLSLQVDPNNYHYYSNLTDPKVFYPDELTDAQQEAHKVGFSLDQNYPNPASEYTIIPFRLDRDGHITIDILDIDGDKVESPLQASFRQTGEDNIYLDTSNFTPGTYFVVLRMEENQISDIMKFNVVR